MKNALNQWSKVREIVDFGSFFLIPTRKEPRDFFKIPYQFSNHSTSIEYVCMYVYCEEDSKLYGELRMRGKNLILLVMTVKMGFFWPIKCNYSTHAQFTVQFQVFLTVSILRLLRLGHKANSAMRIRRFSAAIYSKVSDKKMQGGDDRRAGAKRGSRRCLGGRWTVDGISRVNHVHPPTLVVASGEPSTAPARTRHPSQK